MDSYVGKRLDGRYEIREIIGVGGMAVVYKAYDNIDDRIVAIKILKEEFLANEEFRRRFKNESKAIAVLSHPNIVKVYDVSFGDRLQYIVMEYIEGITLKEYIEQQKVISWKEAVHFTTQILRALQHAHDKGIVHRDVKPQNIMLLQNGNIKVTDFGIARFSRGETRTMTESAIGSVHYISPEQARGEITDDKADIYSVGVVLYEMITGKLPFESDSAVSVAIMQLQNEAVHPREINDQIPIGLEQITLRAMQKNTKDRYQSAAEMLLDLDEFRRNPAIKFDYSYFVDKEPTKYINQQEVANAAQRARPQATPIIPGDDYGDEDDDDEPNKALPVLVGVMSALFAVITLVIIFLALFTDIFSNSKIEVPDFIGMNYTNEIEDNSEYTSNWEFNVKYVTSVDKPAGTVVNQSPYGGAKAKKGSTVTLEVVSGGSLVEIPKIAGHELASAKSTLYAAGFSNLTIQKQFDDSMDPGLVISTEPAEGTKTDTSTTIIVYVSTDINENDVEVPDVVGMNYNNNASEVEEFFTTRGLKIGRVTKEDSEKPAGQVIYQSMDKGQRVPKGTKVDIVISSGIVPNSTVTVKFTLPNTGATESVEIFIDNVLYDTEKVNCSGGVYSKTITSSGSGKSIVINVAGQKAYSATADFTKSPGVLSDEKTYSIEAEIQIPSVTGMTVADAKKNLESYGFKVDTGGASDDAKVLSTNPMARTKAKPSETTVQLITF